MKRAVFLAALAACASEPERLSIRDCEALLAHLTVLEQRDWGRDGPLCKYHPSCAGAEQRTFLEQCPRVLDAAELRCYQAATSLTEADACLRRADLDDRIQAAAGGAAGYADEPAPWLGRTGAAGEAHQVDSLTALREQACACRDAGCVADVTDALEAWKRRNGDPTGKREVELEMQVQYCLRSATTLGGPDPWAPAPDAGGFYDPYGGGSTGITECDDLIREYERFAHCSALPQSSRDAMRDSITQMKDMYRQMGQTGGAGAADACRQAKDSVAEAARASGC